MSEPVDYGEPWEVDQDDDCDTSFCDILHRNGTVAIGSDLIKHKASRIVACVNALAGIEDPEAFMDQLKEVLRSACSACANPRTLGAIHEVMLKLGMSHDD